MARKAAAIKDIRQSRKRRARNISVKIKVRKAIKDALKAIADKKEAKEKVKTAISIIDKAVENGVLHKNTGARRKSRLMLHLNKSQNK